MELAVTAVNTSAVLCVLFGLFILSRDYSSGLYRVFFILSVLISFLALVSGRIFISVERADIIFWDRLYALTAFIFAAVNLHFFLLLTGKKLKALHLVLLYMPAALLSILEFTSYPLVKDFIRINNRWKYVYSGTYYIYMLYSVSYAVTDMALVCRWGRKSRYKKHRLQAGTIVYGAIGVWLACIITDYVLPHFAFYKSPPLGAAGRIIYAFIIWFSFIKYRFLDTTLSKMLGEVLANVRETILVLDHDFNIKIHNTRFNGLLGLDARSRAGANLFDYASWNAGLVCDFAGIMNGVPGSCSGRLEFKTEAGIVTADCDFYGVIDKFGDTEFVLMRLNENRDVNNFREAFGLSQRQMEVIDLALSGFTNTEISDKLNISKKTTEVHFVNIYNKLGINNKIELYNLAVQYNLVIKKPL